MQKSIFNKIFLLALAAGLLLSACQPTASKAERPGTFNAALAEGEFTFFVDLSGNEIPYIKVKATCQGQSIDQIIAGIKENFKIDEKGKFAFKTSEGFTFSGVFSNDNTSASGTYDLGKGCTGKWQAVQTAKAPAVIANVNGTPISGQEFVQRARYKRYVLVSQYARLKDLYAVVSQQNDPTTGETIQQQMTDIAAMLKNPQKVGEQTVEDLVQETIIRQEAERRGIKIDAAEVQNQINHYFNYYPEGIPTPEPGSTPGSGLTPIQKDVFDRKYQTMLQEVAANTGLTEADIRRTFETQLMTTQLANALFPELTEGDEQVHASHILVADLETAQKVLRLLSSGEAWETLAETYTQDPAFSENKGDMGWFGRGEMLSALEEAAFNTPVGQVSSPVQSDYGWHLVKVLEKEIKPFTTERLATVRNQKMGAWLTQQQASGVEIVDGWQQMIPYMPSIPAGQ